MSLSPSHQQLLADVERYEALPCTEEDTLSIESGPFFPYAKDAEAESGEEATS